MTAAVGTAAALSWVAVAAPGAPVDEQRPAQVSGSPISGGTAEAAFFDVDAVDGGVAPPVEDVVDGVWSPSYPSAPADR